MSFFPNIHELKIIFYIEIIIFDKSLPGVVVGVAVPVVVVDVVVVSVLVPGVVGGIVLARGVVVVVPGVVVVVLGVVVVVPVVEAVDLFVVGVSLVGLFAVVAVSEVAESITKIHFQINSQFVHQYILQCFHHYDTNYSSTTNNKVKS